MLQRSPRSKYAFILGTLAAVIALFIAFDSLLTLRSLANSHGSRRTYVVVTHSIAQGENLRGGIGYKDMFSGDAPINALTKKSVNEEWFAQMDLAQGTILTKHMVSKSASQSLTSDERIVFVPSKDVITRDIAKTTDLISVTPNGFGSDVIATDAEIMYDISPSISDEESSDHSGYFVRVSTEEALLVAESLSTGEVRFALSPQTD